MLTAYDRNGESRTASRAERGDGPFYCKSCRAEVVLKKGRILVHHFAHRPPVTCAYGAGETAMHLRAKQAIFEAILATPGVTDAGLEERISAGGITRIPDIHFTAPGGCRVAVEVQRKDLTRETLHSRTLALSLLGFSVVWVLPSLDVLRPHEDKDAGTACRARELFDAMQGLNYGVLYAWSGEAASVIPVHLGKLKRFVEAKDYYNADGDYCYADAYYRTLPSLRKVYQGEPVEITRFHPEGRWRYGKLPDLKLWRDGLGSAWWRDAERKYLDGCRWA